MLGRVLLRASSMRGLEGVLGAARRPVCLPEATGVAFFHAFLRHKRRGKTAVAADHQQKMADHVAVGEYRPFHTGSTMADDETSKAQTASAGEDTIFGKIARGEIKTDFVYEDDQVVAFNDLNPQAPVHVLVIPRKPLVALSKVTDDDEQLLGHLLIAAKRVAVKLDLKKGYRLVINDGRHGGQSVYHLHVHILAGRQLSWPPG